MGSALVAQRVAESALFGHAIAAADVSADADVDEAIAVARSTSVDLLVIRVPVDATSAIHRLERAGATLCDTLLTLQRDSIAAGATAVGTRAEMRMAMSSDADALHALSLQAFADFHGHWHNDDRLTASASTRLYAQWAADLSRSASESRPLILALDAHGAIAGFLALAQQRPGDWFVPLAAVAPPSRGRGLLRALLRHGVEVAERERLDSFHYETQLSNLPAIRVVSQNGFVPHSSRHTFHLWISAQ